MVSSQNNTKATPLGDAPRGKTKEIAGPSQDEHEAPASQDLDDLDVTKMAQKMKASSKRRRDARRSGIEQDHLGAAKEIEIEVQNNFKASIERITEAHKHRLERLSALLKKKASIEDSMTACAIRLENALVEVSHEFQIGLQGRLNDTKRLGLG